MGFMTAYNFNERSQACCIHCITLDIITIFFGLFNLKQFTEKFSVKNRTQSWKKVSRVTNPSKNVFYCNSLY